MEANILAASVHIAIFPPTYKLSKWRFDELALMIKSSVESRTFVIPVFYDAEVSELRRTGEKALRNYEKKKLYDGQTIKEWRNALSLVTGISGFVVEEGPRGENELLNKLVKSVFYDFGDGPRHQVFINHRGEVKENFARPLYNRLVSSGLKVFLDEPEMVRGLWIASQLEVGIQCAPVTIAVFSPKYAQSRWCLEELSLTVRSGNTIIPVLYGVKRSDLQCPEDGVYAKDLLNHKNKHPYDSETPQKWRDALSEVAKLPGYELDGNKEDLLDKIVQMVKKDFAKPSVVVESSEVQSVLKSLLKEDVPKQSENFPAGKQFESGEDNGPSDYGLSNNYDWVGAFNVILHYHLEDNYYTNPVFSRGYSGFRHCRHFIIMLLSPSPHISLVAKISSYI